MSVLFLYVHKCLGSVRARGIYLSWLPLTGPSPPRLVQVTAGSNSEVCATWRPPAAPVGPVLLYHLYAEIVASSVEIVDIIDLPTDTLVKACNYSFCILCTFIVVHWVIGLICRHLNYRLGDC